MLAIKFQRIGKKHQPSFRIVVAEKRSKLLSPPVEDLGYYDPFTKSAAVKKERAAYWLGIGAQPTPTVHNVFVKEGILSTSKIRVQMRKKKSAPEGESAPPKGAANASAAPQGETGAKTAEAGTGETRA
ncbi:MAG: 30S ribosomal protein S16 [Candidatus Liptonbacteria bacterium]|nr:30S ribosomal protein S16 [Candidatus Liptonbacteria bacterium]